LALYITLVEQFGSVTYTHEPIMLHGRVFNHKFRFGVDVMQVDLNLYIYAGLQ
jgi:hypothetical protein